MNRITSLKKIALVALLMFVVSLPMAAQKKNYKVSYLSPGSFYVYGMGTWLSGVPADFNFGSEYYYENKDAIGPTVGLGFTLIKFGSKSKMNVEFDATTAEFAFSPYYSSRIWYYTLMLNMEFWFYPKTPMGIFMGVGGASVNYGDPDSPDVYAYDYNDITLAINFGIKAELVKKSLLLRAEVRHYWTVQDWGGEYWEDGWFWEDEVLSTHFGTAVSVGLELHF